MSGFEKVIGSQSGQLTQIICPSCPSTVPCLAHLLLQSSPELAPPTLVGHLGAAVVHVGPMAIYLDGPSTHNRGATFAPPDQDLMVVNRKILSRKPWMGLMPHSHRSHTATAMRSKGISEHRIVPPLL